MSFTNDNIRFTDGIIKKLTDELNKLQITDKKIIIAKLKYDGDKTFTFSEFELCSEIIPNTGPKTLKKIYNIKELNTDHFYSVIFHFNKNKNKIRLSKIKSFIEVLDIECEK